MKLIDYTRMFGSVALSFFRQQIALISLTFFPLKLLNATEPFREVLALYPFGATKAHRVWLRYLKHVPEPICELRISANGSRKEVEMLVSIETFAGLEYIFHQFSLDPELVPERPLQLNAFGGD